jgi:hypothetical protein
MLEDGGATEASQRLRVGSAERACTSWSALRDDPTELIRLRLALRLACEDNLGINFQRQLGLDANSHIHTIARHAHVQRAPDLRNATKASSTYSVYLSTETHAMGPVRHSLQKTPNTILSLQGLLS